MTKLPSFARLDGLFALDQRGIDVRPILLRVLTDQYLAIPHPTPQEEQEYCELAMRLLDQTEIPVRVAVAARLARHPAAPRAMILRLAHDVTQVAEPILLHSPCLSPADCATIARQNGPSHAALIADRSKAPPLVAPVIPPAETAKAENRESVAEASELCDLFFTAGSAERRLILLMLDCMPGAAPCVLLQRPDSARIEASALAHNAIALARDIAQTFGLSAGLARRIVNDDLGEPFVAAAKAMNLRSDVLQRMLLFMNPVVGQSINRVYDLAGLYNEISTEAAQRLIAIWSAASPAPPVATDATLYAPYDTQRWDHVAATARRILSGAPRPLEREHANLPMRNRVLPSKS